MRSIYFFSLVFFSSLLQAQSPDPFWGLKLIHAPKAWQLSTGSKAVLVAVIDTGADLQHPDLRENIWTNPGENGTDRLGRNKASNQVDDDQNGYVDDVHGWNFVNSNADLTDHHGHGTHIAGIIGAHSANEYGAIGVNQKVNLMILKFYDPHSPDSDPLEKTIQAIRYAVKMKAKIINYSGGGTRFSAAEKAAVQFAADHGVLFVAASGNEHSDSDVHGFYPADYGLPNIISVTAIDPRGQVLPSSNFGKRSVYLAAPGQDIYSTLPGGTFGLMSGTSQATAFVTGVAALLLGAHSDLQQPEDIVNHLVHSGTSDIQLNGKTKFHTRLDSYRALAMQSLGTTLAGFSTPGSSREDRNQVDWHELASRLEREVGAAGLP